ncbi:Abi family protein [Companilactobacillus farciminis]|uniref:Abi family protein n=1 Tax=Companilactobacillus farciminis TaxID=1612 RepID=UPI0034D4B0B7
MEKRMMSTNELINHMKSKGITFNFISENEASKTLNKVNYYFKVTSYRSNFPKNESNKYENLDFAYLVDLASIDMQLREYLFDLSIDIEHGIKVLLLNLISNDVNEDGYSIVEDFKINYPNQYQRTLKYLEKNKYLHDMYKKHHNNISIWVFLEVMTFGTLSIFVDFYLKRKNTRSVRQIHNYLKFSKNIRNACAHSNPLLVNIFSDKEFLRRPSAPIKSAAKQMNIPMNYLQDLKINDLVSLFFLHKKIQSKKMSEHRYNQGKKILTRFHRHKDWYADNTKLNTFFKILDILIDYINVQ